MTSNTQLQVHHGEHGRLYFTIGQTPTPYDIAFPLDLALKIHYHSNVGHHVCGNCRAYASFNGIATSICLNCSYITGFNQYDCQCSSMHETVSSALHSFLENGFMTIGCNTHNCPHQTYLKDVDFTTFALSHEHQEILAYQQFTTLFNYPF
jgi:hypothetical protein